MDLNIPNLKDKNNFKDFKIKLKNLLRKSVIPYNILQPTTKSNSQKLTKHKNRI